MSKNNKETMISELKENDFDIDDLPKDVLTNALIFGYKLVNNHFMAYTDGSQTWYIDYWF